MKTRVVHAALALLSLWPLAQMGLVARWDVSPWKLAGWGMYATPRFDMVGMEVYGRLPDGGEQQLTDAAPALRAQATAFLESYRWLRDLAPHARFARAVLAANPQWTAVRLVLFRPTLDARTGMVELTRAEYAHPRR
ncbi:MAG: hypothetical protein KIT14_05445 [bacterium]|nr:hypothetical protein [bacterium]